MPYRKKYRRKRTTRRKNNRGMTKWYPRRNYLPLSGFPQRKMVKLRYAEVFALNPAASSVATYVFRANSVYDPNFTVTGHQPLGFDQWAAIYNRYTVLGSKITLSPSPADLTNVYPVQYGVILSDDSADIASLTSTEILEGKYGSDRPKQIGTDLLTPKNPRAVKKFSAKKFFGTKDVLGGAAYGASVTANPSQDAYFHCYSQSIGSTDGASLNFTAIVDYIVMFHNPVTMTSS